MTRSKLLIALIGTSLLLTIIVAGIVSMGRRVDAQRNRALKTIQDALERQEIRHQAVEYAWARLPQESGLPANWGLEQAMADWQSNEIDVLAKLAKQLTERKKGISAGDKEKLRRFVMDSSELRELLAAIESGVCEIKLDPAKGQWQISNGQIEALRAMAYMLAARAILLADDGDRQGVLSTILSSYALMDVLVDVPNISVQSYRPGMLLYIEYAIRRAVSPDEISDDSKAVLLRHLTTQASKEPIVNALKLHEALVRQEVSAKRRTSMVPWLLAGYQEGMNRVIRSIDEPQNSVLRQCDEILDEVPIFAGQTKWRLQNVAPNALEIRIKTQRHLDSIREFLKLKSARD
jgi:hypothetical protein